MSYYPEPDNHVKDKVKLELSYQAYQIMLLKELQYATGVDKSD